jgi:hypothetical protein
VHVGQEVKFSPVFPTHRAGVSFDVTNDITFLQFRGLCPRVFWHDLPVVTNSTATGLFSYCAGQKTAEAKKNNYP